MTAQRKAPSRRASKSQLQPVVICTAHRGVFFGMIDPKHATQKTIRIENARNCIYWAQTIGGVVGLSRSGPNNDCHIGAEAPAIVLHDVTAVMTCTPNAAKAWQEAPCVS